MLIDDDNTFLPEAPFHYEETFQQRFCITDILVVLASSGLQIISKQSDVWVKWSIIENDFLFHFIKKGER